MSLQEHLKKIDIDTLDTKGIYYKDIGLFAKKKIISKSDLKKIDYENIDIVLKFYFRNKTIKRTVKYSNITALQAVKKAIAHRAKLKEELELNGAMEKKNFKSLNELFEDYIEFKKESLSRKNIYSTTTTYNKWINDSIGDLAIDKIQAPDIQNIVNHMLKIGKSPRTAQSIKQILRPLFNYAIDLNLVDSNPSIKVNLPSFDNSVNFQLSEEKRKKLYQEILKYEPLKYRGIMIFLYFGRRLNEVLTLKYENIDFEKGFYTIEDKYSKIRRRQEYPLLQPMFDFFKVYETLKNSYVFKGITTEYVTAHTFREHWKKLIKNADIEKMRIHDTRHLLGNTMVNRGESLENIGKVLGHSSSTVTKRYAKTSLNTADRLLNDYLT